MDCNVKVADLIKCMDLIKVVDYSVRVADLIKVAELDCNVRVAFKEEEF